MTTTTRSICGGRRRRGGDEQVMQASRFDLFQNLLKFRTPIQELNGLVQIHSGPKATIFRPFFPHLRHVQGKESHAYLAIRRRRRGFIGRRRSGITLYSSSFRRNGCYVMAVTAVTRRMQGFRCVVHLCCCGFVIRFDFFLLLLLFLLAYLLLLLLFLFESPLLGFARFVFDGLQGRSQNAQDTGFFKTFSNGRFLHGFILFPSSLGENPFWFATR